MYVTESTARDARVGGGGGGLSCFRVDRIR